tara:strand:- start:28 stop:792 length:765 start_codon:yes stop_codon:yes gene_type:complete
MYCVFLGKAVQTVVPGQGSVGTSQLADSSVTNVKLGSDINATKLTAGLVPTARLGSGTASSSTVLYGDQTFKAEPSGGLAYINGLSFTSSTAYANINDCFSATYDQYLIIINDLIPETDGAHLVFQFSTSGGSAVTSSQYNYAYYGWDSAGSGAPNGAGNNQASWRLCEGIEDSESSYQGGLNGHLWIQNPYDTNMTRGNGITQIRQTSSGDTQYQTNAVQCEYVTAAITGFRIYPSAGNNAIGHIKVYGLVNS